MVILKHRFTEFLVNEIDINGNVLFGKRPMNIVVSNTFVNNINNINNNEEVETNSFTYDMFNYEINTFLKAAKKFLLNTPNIENVNLG